MNLFVWIIFGIIAGFVGNALDGNKHEGGLIGALLIGIVGGVLGGLLAHLIFGIGFTRFDPLSFIIATTGALLLLFFGRGLVRYR